MKLTNAQGFNSLNTLRELHEEGKLGFAIARNIRKLEGELADFIEKRDELIRKYGSLEDDHYFVTEARIPDFLNELNVYSGMEFEFQPQLVDADTFCSGKLNSDQMYVLDWMVSD